MDMLDETKIREPLWEIHDAKCQNQLPGNIWAFGGVSSYRWGWASPFLCQMVQDLGALPL
jgi:hypothetical protein